MSKRGTNVNNGGTVGIQAADRDDDQDRSGDDRNTRTTNVNNGGTVGIQGGTVSGNTVIITN